MSIFSGLIRLSMERVALRCASGSLGNELSTPIHKSINLTHKAQKE
jgi:hypothetical protein